MSKRKVNVLNRNGHVVLCLLAMGLAALIVSSCGKTPTAQAEEVRTTDITSVAVAKAGVEDMSHKVVLTAEFKPYQEVDVMAKVAGYVKKINVDVGDRVQEGQLLAVLEIPEMADDQARAQSALNRSKAEVARARDELQRAESSHTCRAPFLYAARRTSPSEKPGLIAQQEIDDAQSKDLVAEAQVSAAKSTIAAAEQQVQVGQAECKRSRRCSITRASRRRSPE